MTMLPAESGKIGSPAPTASLVQAGGEVYELALDIQKPIPDLRPPAGVTKAACRIEAGVASLDELTLPVFDGLVPAYVLSDVIASEFAWEILEQFFEIAVYPGLRIERRPDGLAILRGDVLLADGLPLMEGPRTRYLHDHVGWAVFLQEFWGRPDQPLGFFYDAGGEEPGSGERRVSGDLLAVDAGEDLLNLSCEGNELRVLFSVGGANLALVPVGVSDGGVTAPRIRAAITEACGFELCTASVREGILGRPYSESLSLRDRLRDAARHRAETRLDPEPDRLEQAGDFLAEWPAAVGRALAPETHGIALGRRSGSGCETSAARRVAFPASVSPEILEATSRLGEPVAKFPSGSGAPGRAVYCPELFAVREESGEGDRFALSSTTCAPPLRRFDRGVFEELYASKVDPWNVSSRFEKAKYEQSLELLPSGRFGRALEVGCAEGHFTRQLAPRVDHLVAADISHLALERAAQHCRECRNVETLPLDLARDPIPGRFDLIVCSEVLYFLGRAAFSEAAARLARALEPGGYLLTANANLVVDEPESAGYRWDHEFGAKTISDIFTGMPELRLLRELRTPLYRIQLLQRVGDAPAPAAGPEPEIRAVSRQPVQPPPQVEADVLWQGGSPARAESEEPTQTDRLPILMYHRVASDGAEALAQYRVSPAQFEEQLQYLKDTAHYAVSIEEWHVAMRRHEPLPGRAVLLTFDDGYLDFATQAWPLLEKYGFSATVFLVAGEVGGTNRWDRRFGEEVPLLGWEEIRRLADLGVEFGSHSTSHPDLTRIPPAEVVQEAIRSRAILQEGLGRPVRSFAYPHGGEDQVVRHLVGGSGYTYGFSCRPGRAGLWEPLLALPRIEVSGHARFDDFVRQLRPERPADEG
jgi:peptidoglycan/xylan/chitin deacetylase (PgdA/CDA1 family)/SAM-dependent methyltransferase